jgi:hypothetical protein
MAAAAHNPRFARKVGLPQRVARDFYAADHGMALGGSVQPGGLDRLSQTDDVLRNASHRLLRLQPFAAGGMADEPADPQEQVEALQAELQSLLQRVQEIVQQLEQLGVPIGDEQQEMEVPADQE